MNQTKGKALEKPRTGKKATQSGNKISTGRKVLLEEIKCHACGKKGHYKGSKECPKMPTSKRLHAISVDSKHEERGTQETEEPFEGEEYKGESNQEFNDTSEDEEEYESYGMTVGTIHIDSDSEDEDLEETTVTIAMMAASNTKDEETLAVEIVNSIKEDYELQGSGQKPKPRGPTTKQQLKAEAQKSQAIISNVDGERLEGHKNKPRPQPPLDVSGVTAYIKINSVKALMCWDSASQLDCISPDFIWAIGLKPQTKAEPVIRLGLKGSSSRCSYEVTPTIELGEKKIENFTLSVANI